MSEERWIVIPKWDVFQHYKNRDPVWIKTFVRQVRDDDYLRLSLSQRGLLHDLRMLYAESNGQLNETATRRRLGTNKAESRHLLDNLEALNHAGFIQLSASRPLASRDRDRDRPPISPKNNKCPECQVTLIGSLKDHLANVHNIEVA